MKTLTEFSTIVLRRAAAARVARTAEGLEGEALITAIAGDLSLQEDRVQRLMEALDVAGEDLDKVRLVRVFQGETGPIGSTSKGEFHYAVDRVGGTGGGRRSDRGDRGDRGGRGGGDRGGGGGGRGGGGDMFGGPRKEKPRGLGSLKAAAAGAPKDDRDDRVRPGEVPRAGIGWQLQAAPRDPRDAKGRGKGGPPAADVPAIAAARVPAAVPAAAVVPAAVPAAAVVAAARAGRRSTSVAGDVGGDPVLTARVPAPVAPAVRVPKEIADLAAIVTSVVVRGLLAPAPLRTPVRPRRWSQPAPPRRPIPRLPPSRILDRQNRSAMLGGVGVGGQP